MDSENGLVDGPSRRATSVDPENGLVDGPSRLTTTRSETFSTIPRIVIHDAAPMPPLQHRPLSDRNRLAPEDAFFAHSPSRRQQERTVDGKIDAHTLKADVARADIGTSSRHDKSRGRSGSRRRKGAWKKLLWIKQSYPDNYTDAPTFLSQLQRNPRLLPYDFWPLVADSTVIVQHICSVAIFVSCFVGIYQEHVSPVSVVSWGSVLTVLGWIFWDFWVGQEEAARSLHENTYSHKNVDSESEYGGVTEDSTFGIDNRAGSAQALGLGLSLPTSGVSTQNHSRYMSSTSLHTTSSLASPVTSGHPTGASQFATSSYYPPYNAPDSPFSPRNQQRLATAKSAVLITCALLGLSPILKSLTKSTTSDSIWAISCFLFCINVFFFDYGGGVGVKFPASLSTNAAVMASTVLASRLPSSTHVFSLTLFSIEVFGLFPVFRRHLRHRSWHLHVMLTILLITAAGAGMGVVLKGGGVRNALLGIGIWGCGTVLVMGGCSRWLIGLQRYKNVVIGPWDPARPIIRGGRD